MSQTQKNSLRTKYFSAPFVPELSELRSEAAASLSFPSPEAALTALKQRTVVLTFLAGSGSRWIRSLRKAECAGAPTGFDERKPRGLYRVPNVLPPGRVGQQTLPIAAYSLAAVQGLGHHLIMTSGFETEIEQEILQPLQFSTGEYEFLVQERLDGVPLGHGAAAYQALPHLQNADYVICNFGGDPNSRVTIETALLCISGLESEGQTTGLVLPAAWVETPQHPIEMDSKGRPLAFHHAKLRGGMSDTAHGWSNVGVRVYRKIDLASVLSELHSRYWDDDVGYCLPGNSNHELALDNVDTILAERGRVRLLPCARPEEIISAKTLEDIPQFLRAAEQLARV